MQTPFLSYLLTPDPPPSLQTQTRYNLELFELSALFCKSFLLFLSLLQTFALLEISSLFGLLFFQKMAQDLIPLLTSMHVNSEELEPI